MKGGKTFEYFAKHRVPELKNERAVYFHELNVLLENQLASTEDLTKEQMKSIKTASSKLYKYCMQRRNKLNKEHRLLLWVVRARLFYLSYPYKQGEKYKQFDFDPDYLMKVGLSIRSDHPAKYSLKDYLRILDLLRSKFNELKYNESLCPYTNTLIHCAGNFMSNTSRQKKFFDHPSYCSSFLNGRFGINQKFIVETEVLFFNLQKRFFIYDLLSPKKEICHAQNSEALLKLRQHLENIAQPPALQFIREDVAEQYYEWFLKIADRDNYVLLGNPKDSPASQIMTTMNEDDAQKCSEALDRNDLIKSILPRIQKPGSMSDDDDDEEWNDDAKSNSQYFVDFELQGICISVLNQFFYKILKIKKKFSDLCWISTKDLENINFINIKDPFPFLMDFVNIKEPFPLLVQHFNESSICYKDQTIEYQDFPTCFLEWVRLVCEDPKIQGFLPNKEANLVYLYEIFFEKEKETIARLKKMLLIRTPEEYGITMPGFYNEITDLSISKSISNNNNSLMV